MGMSTYVVAIRAPDDKWRKMKAAWDACEAAGIDPPKEVRSFFEDMPPDQRGVIVEIERHPAVSEYSDEDESGFEVELAKLPAGITHVWFYNSW